MAAVMASVIHAVVIFVLCQLGFFGLVESTSPNLPSPGVFGRFMSNLLSFDELTLAVARK